MLQGMAYLSSSDDLKDFESYHHTMTVKMTDINQGSTLQFIGEFFDSGKRYEKNNPGETGKVLDQIHDGSNTIYHYFCNRSGALTGIAGGMEYTYNGLNFYIGYTNPLIGCKKSFIELTKKKKSAKWAYEKAEDDDPKTTTCSGWRAEASFEDSERPVLNVYMRMVDECY